MIGFFYFTTQFFQDVLGWSPLRAGLGFLPMTVVNFVVATRVSSMARRIGNPALLTTGIAITLGGMAWLSRLGTETDFLLGVALPMVLIGAGQGMAFAPLTSFGISGVEAQDAGAASGLLNTAHQLGMALGLSVLVAIAAGVAGDGPEARAVQVSDALTGSSALLALALIVVVVVLGPRRGKQYRRP
jgi:hypothetical protein